MHGLPLLAAAAGVGIGHAVLPDHWLPLAVVGRTQRKTLPQIARLSVAAGIAHVLVSLALGVVIILVGLQFRHTVEHAQDLIVGAVLLATGLAFAALELTGRGHHHGHDHHEHRHNHSHRSGLLATIVPFGAAASPDLTILPVFLAATAISVSVAIGSLVVFAIATVATFVLLTLLVARTGYEIHGQWIERWGNAITAGALLVIGGLVITGAI